MGRRVETTGHVRTLGGVDVYLALRARIPGLGRAAVDSAVERGELKVSTATRGCIYLVPRRDWTICLRFADMLRRQRDDRDQERAGIRPGELEEVGNAVVGLLSASGPLPTDGVRRALPEDVVRGLGDRGKKVGVFSTLPPALRRLEFEGRVERTLEGGRLDSERYLWQVPKTNPFEADPVPDDPAELHVRMAEIFFRAAGVASMKAFAAWAGIPQKDAKAALEKLDLLPVAVPHMAEICFILQERRPLLDEPGVPSTVALLPNEDNLLAFQGGPAAMVDPEFHGLAVPRWGRSDKAPLGEVGHYALRSVLVGTELAGFWKFDPVEAKIVFSCFSEVGKKSSAEIEAAAQETAAFLRDEMGHAKSVILDSDKSLHQRAELIRQMTAGR